MKTGLVSVTFRDKNPEEIIKIVKEEKLDSIEWGSDVHIPPNDLKNASEILKKMDGLETISYGTYYRIGEDMSFNEYLETAIAIKTKNIRVWAGRKNREDANEEYFEKAVKDATCIADKAKKYGIDISFEYHLGTLTNSQNATIELLSTIDRENVYTYWQALKNRDIATNIKDISQLSSMKKLKNIHAFQWKNEDVFMLSEGFEEWKTYLSNANANACLLEFVKDNKIENYRADAKTLKEILSNI